MNAATTIKDFAIADIEPAVNAADPHKLISMLYEGALLAIANAKNGIIHNDDAAKSAAISKAILIIDEGLNASLDKNAGGELAQNLAKLYEYMSMRLITANLKDGMAALNEVEHLLNDLKEAWDSIGPPAATPAQPKPANTAQQTYGRG